VDLDETLICAYESSSLPAAVRTQAIEAGLHCFDMECISSEKASMMPSLRSLFQFSSHFLARYLWGSVFVGLKDAEGRQRVNHVTVFERPGMHEFLKQTSEFADLILFTAGLEGFSFGIFILLSIKSRDGFTA
jgi:RNA polymerase II subunit A small phosphatase-like protein